MYITVTYDAAVQHLVSGPRLPFTAAYFGSIALTLFFSLGVSWPYTDPLAHTRTKLAQPLSLYPTHSHSINYRRLSSCSVLTTSA